MAKNILPDKAAVLYLRMCSSKQDKSISAQRDELLKLAKFKGYAVVREYLDEAVSGDATDKRAGFLKLREDCEKGPDFSIILVWHEDRFSRNDPLEYGFWLKPIRDSGVVLETPAGRVDWEISWRQAPKFDRTGNAARLPPATLPQRGTGTTGGRK